MNAVRTITVLVNLFFVASLFCNKIVYLISPPRSLSVAFLRMMEARGDFSIMHEPSQSFYASHVSDVANDMFRADAFQSFEEVKMAILQAAQDNHVFVKEISSSVREFHCNDIELMNNPDVYFVFLMRNPHHAIISMYKKFQERLSAEINLMAKLMGYDSLYEIVTVAKRHAINRPYIILSEDLYNNPEKTIRQFCNHVGVEFKPEALQWDDLGEQFDGHDQWHEAKYKEFTQYWHGDAIRSTGFGKPSSYMIDEHGNPTFSEITNLEHRNICKKIYLDQLPYYELLIENEKN